MNLFKLFNFTGPLAMIAVPATINTNVNQRSNNIYLDTMEGEWVYKLQSNVSTFMPHYDHYWNVNDFLDETSKYIVTAIGSINGRDVFNIYLKDVQRNYAYLVLNRPYDKATVDKNYLKVKLASAIIKRFEAEMIETSVSKDLMTALSTKETPLAVEMSGTSQINMLSVGGKNATTHLKINLGMAEFVDQALLNAQDDKFIRIEQNYIKDINFMLAYQLISPPLYSLNARLNNINFNGISITNTWNKNIQVPETADKTILDYILDITTVLDLAFAFGGIAFPGEEFLTLENQVIYEYFKFGINAANNAFDDDHFPPMLGRAGIIINQFMTEDLELAFDINWTPYVIPNSINIGKTILSFNSVIAAINYDSYYTQYQI